MNSETEKAILAGGCFWGAQEILRQQNGVIETRVGYTGGNTADPTYEDVKAGQTGHAEAVEIIFDPSTLSYSDLLRLFFRLHDPTTINRQDSDVGTQYRSAIFFENLEQRSLAEQIRAEVEQSGRWKDPVVTEISPAKGFFPAEDYHQDYLQKNPLGYNCHWLRPE
ncbi:MAG: peptide-methionine (S)-S-oxide reductase [Deltaproteobacteria bacterium CG11_big_fil_rev_8_21_14_0_20_45_16]|nr:MAG: peptide-methionine (S)-S-oxide reductase [Deltaproteobacteria bacterium CG11_big_fil_rev_8_21_14_0_20_45_16]